MKRVKYLLRDDFTTAAAAPLASPRVCEPGPGTLTLVQEKAQMSITSGRLVVPPASDSSWGGVSAYSPLLARACGRTMFCSFNRGSSGYNWIGWNTAVPRATGTHAILFAPGGPLYISSPQMALGPSIQAGVEYQIAVVARDVGAFYFLKGGEFAEWTLVWVQNTSSQSQLYSCITTASAQMTADYLRVLDLAELDPRFADDYGLATSRIPGNVSVGQTFTHEADFVMEWTQTAMPAGNHEIRFREHDSQNAWRVIVSAAGQISLWEMVNGASTGRYFSAGSTVADGHRIVVASEGSTIRLYSNNTLRTTYTTAENFKTATRGRNASASGAGGQISNLVTYPRHVTLPNLDAKPRSLFGSTLFGSRLFEKGLLGGTL